MDIENQETTYFRYCRTLEGRLVPVDTIKRNGRLVPRFSPEDLEPVSVADDPLTAVARGTGVILENLEAHRDVFLENDDDLS